MTRQAVEAELRSLMKSLRIRWSKDYLSYTTDRMKAVIANLRLRVQKEQAVLAMMEAKRAMPEPEDELLVPSEGAIGPLGNDCGGGRRVVRSTRGL